MAFYKTWQTGNKYHAKSTTYGENRYDSKKEATKAFELDLMVKAKQIKSWTKQPRIELLGQNRSRICYYKCDFLVIHNDDTLEYIEIKSPITATYAWKLKWKLLEDKFKLEIKQGEVKLTVEY